MYFERVTPESVGIRSKDIEEFLEKEYKAGIQLHSFMLVRHGKVAAEGWYHPYSADGKHAIFSFSKTFTATAVGFAEQEGILSLDEKLVELFPDELPDTISENLALADIGSLLTMSCGHEAEITEDEIAANGGNWVKAFFAQEFKYRPHTMFQYNTFGTDLVSAILEKKTGQSLTQFLKPRLFDPLGITDYTCARMGDHLVEPGAPYSGIEGGGWGFHMLTEDLAKFIWFLSRRGVWEGKRLLREEWFDRAFTKQIETLNDVYAPVKSNWQQGYCYQCWCNPTPGSWRADGLHGQFGYVLPDQDAVMIITAACINTEMLLNIFTQTIADRMSKDPLPEDPAQAQSLRRKLQYLRIPGLWAVRQSWSEELLDGKTYLLKNPEGISFEEYVGGEGHFGRNQLKLESVTLKFEENHLLLTITQTGGQQGTTGSSTQSCSQKGTTGSVTQTLEVGLDGEDRKNVLSDGVYFASGKWIWSDEMELEVRYQEALGSAFIRLRLDADSLIMAARNQMPEENPLTKRRLRTLQTVMKSDTLALGGRSC